LGDTAYKTFVPGLERARADLRSGLEKVGIKGKIGSPVPVTLPDDTAGTSSGGGKGKTKGGGKPLSQAEQLALMEKQLANDPWSKLGQGLVAQDQAIEANVMPYVSGQETAPAVAQAANQALSSLGISPNSGAAQWLSGQLGQGAAAAAPLQGAMQTYGNAYAAGNAGVDMALGNLGQANALNIATAPEQAWLGVLQNAIQYNLMPYGSHQLPAGTALPPAIQSAFTNLGYSVAGGKAGTIGGVPVGNFGTTPTTQTDPSITNYNPGGTKAYPGGGATVTH
jgi:hypothetical protein